MNRRARLAFLVAGALLFAPLGAHAAEKGWFGFALAIDADGILNPRLRSIKVDKVFPASPAEKAVRPVDGVAMPDPAPAQQLEASSESLNPAL